MVKASIRYATPISGPSHDGLDQNAVASSDSTFGSALGGVMVGDHIPEAVMGSAIAADGTINASTTTKPRRVILISSSE